MTEAPKHPGGTPTHEFAREKERGSIYLVGLFTVAFATFIGYTILELSNGLGDQDRNAYLLLSTIGLIRSNLMTLVQQPISGYQTAYYNCTIKGTMCCLKTNTCFVSPTPPVPPSVPSAPETIAVYGSLSNATAGAYYDGTLPASGFDMTGAPCTTYPTSPCVIHINLQWQPDPSNAFKIQLLAASPGGITVSSTATSVTTGVAQFSLNAQQQMMLNQAFAPF